MKVRGQNSNRNTAKQTAEIGQKISGDEDVADILSLVPSVMHSRLRKGLELDQVQLVDYGRSPAKQFRMIMNNSNRSLYLA